MNSPYRINLIFYFTTTLNLPNDIIQKFLVETFPKGVVDLLQPVLTNELTLASFIPLLLSVVVAMNGCEAIIVTSNTIFKFENSSKTPEAFEFIRVMTQEDMMIYEEIKKEEVTSFFKCKELVKKHNLNMNLVQCRLTFDKRKISFYYTAPERVDFRGLLKDLTQIKNVF